MFALKANAMLEMVSHKPSLWANIQINVILNNSLYLRPYFAPILSLYSVIIGVSLFIIDNSIKHNLILYSFETILIYFDGNSP